jgi:PPP family 3-phenylpropionic acid transporter
MAAQTGGHGAGREAAGPSASQAPGTAAASPQALTLLAPGYALRLSFFFAALFLVAGVKLPYLPVWLDWRGLTGPEIAAITAAPLFLRIVAGPLIALAADWSGDRRRAAVILAWASLAALGLLAAADGFWPILGATLVMALATTGIMPLAETIAMAGVRLGGLDYGRMRLWGSLSFVAAGFAAGAALGHSGPGSILWLLLAAAVFTAIVAHALPREAGTGTEGGRRRFASDDALALVRDRRFLLFLAAAGAVQASHAVFYTFGVIEWRRQGLSPMWAGVLWAVGVGVEIIIFAMSRRAVERVGALGLLLAGALAGLVRWTAMAADPPLAALVALQALHGLTFGAAHLGALHVMAALVPPSAAGTGQALYASVTAGIAMGLATLASGPLYQALGGRAYLVMAVLAGLGTIGALLLWRTGLKPRGTR